MKYLKLFDNHNDYDSYTDNMITPNVSYCLLEDEVHFNEFVDPRIVAKFNVTSTSQPTRICGYEEGGKDIYDSSTYFSKIEIDGVEMANKTYQYTFSSTGEHIVKYTLIKTDILDAGAFIDCTQLTSISIPNSVVEFSRGVFYGCTGLTSLSLPSELTIVPENMCYMCTSLQNIIIPSSIKSIGDYAFELCYSMKNVEFNTNVLTEIGGDAFEGCSGLTNVTLPESVEYIGTRAFKDCSELETINMPQSLTKIGEEAFDGCEKLSCSITLPSTTTTIGNGAFNGCPLTEVICLATTPPSVYRDTIPKPAPLPTVVTTFGNSSNQSTSPTYPLYVPSSSLSEYKSSTNVSVSGYHTWGKYYAHRTFANPN